MDQVVTKHGCTCELCQPVLGEPVAEPQHASEPENRVQNVEEVKSAGIRVLDEAYRQWRWIASGALF